MVGNVFHNFRNRKGTGKHEKIIKMRLKKGNIIKYV